METWDAGDGIADVGAKVIFSSIGWRITDTGAWQDPTWDGSENCDSGAPGPHENGYTQFLDLNCDRSNIYETQFYAWSTTN